MAASILLRPAINSAARWTSRCITGRGTPSFQRTASSYAKQFSTAITSYSFDDVKLDSGSVVGSSAQSLLTRIDVHHQLNIITGSISTWMPSIVSDIKSLLSNIASNLSGNGVLITMDSYDVSRSNEKTYEEEWEDLPNTSSQIASSLMDTTSTNGDLLSGFSLWQISTLKRRKKMMNKHKLRKRRKKLRLKTRK
eukprot:scaffold2048_cov204-Alexandrium_tamarense.AAC.28